MGESGGVVRAGPFAGLRYPVAQAAGSSLAPKLLGTYELEIHDFVESAIKKRPTRIVNIGAGEDTMLLEWLFAFLRRRCMRSTPANQRASLPWHWRNTTVLRAAFTSGASAGSPNFVS